MKTSTIVWVVVIILVLAGGIYYLTVGSGNPYSAPSNASNTSVPTVPPTPTTPSTPTTGATTSGAPSFQVMSDPNLGSFLAAANGMTLYTYANDAAGVSNCSGTCATIWPPFTVSSAANLVADPNMSGTLGTITRTDGGIQVTYNGLPLYFYQKDSKPGDVTGQGVGGVWAVAKP